MSLAYRFKVIAKHRLGDGVILMVYKALQVLTLIQLKKFICKKSMYVLSCMTCLYVYKLENNARFDLIC